MSNGEASHIVDGGLEALDRAVHAWITRSQSRPLRDWLDRELDPEGVPRRVPVPAWLGCLSQLTEARRAHPAAWPESFDARIEGFVRGLLRFSRPGGTPVFSGDTAPAHQTRAMLREWADQLSDPGLATVLDWWFPSRQSNSTRHSPPPLPAWSSSIRPLATLRSDWSKQGGFLSVDHREPRNVGSLESFALGRNWLGPSWISGEIEEQASTPKLLRWVSNSSADLAEWSFRTNDRRVLRTALVLRGRQLALLADQVEGGGPSAAMQVTLPGSVNIAPIVDSRGLTLSASGESGSLRVFPVGLPRKPYDTERGSLAVENERLVLRHSLEGKRCWLPLLLSWNSLRNRKKADWRLLTVSERSQVCPPGTAYAARISWGPDETLVIYRSLGRPALRSFLGHQTRARFLVGLFSKAGEVEPILKVEDP